MQLICPQCHTNNRFGAERPAAAARFVCVGCRTEFDAVLIDGALRTVLPRDAHALAPDPPEDIFDILSIPQEPPAEVFAEAAPAQVLEDVFAAEPIEIEAPPAQTSAATAGEAEPFHVTESAEVGVAPPPAQDARAEAAPATRIESPAAGKQPPAPGRVPPPPAVDKYAVGMRVLRVSPVWLLLSTVGFFGVLLTLSWMSQPVGPVGEAVAAAGAKLPNQATNPAPVALVEGAKATAEKALPPAPKESVKPAAEAAQAPAPPPAAQHFSAAAGRGNFTVQVGSFNDPSEANQRVSQLRAAGFEARAVAVELPQRGTWYRVQAGRFETRDEAAKAGAQMRAKGAADAAIVTEVGAQ
jgi:hypothetical protein